VIVHIHAFGPRDRENQANPQVKEASKVTMTSEADSLLCELRTSMKLVPMLTTSAMLVMFGSLIRIVSVSVKKFNHIVLHYGGLE
jgi:hypothetical protein